jgi:hypothetical protein
MLLHGRYAITAGYIMNGWVKQWSYLVKQLA